MFGVSHGVVTTVISYGSMTTLYEYLVPGFQSMDTVLVTVSAFPFTSRVKTSWARVLLCGLTSKSSDSIADWVVKELPVKEVMARVSPKFPEGREVMALFLSMVKTR